MNLDSVPILALFASAVVIIMISIEAGYRLGRIFHRRSKQEKESPVSAVAGAVLALVAFMLAFTFGIAATALMLARSLCAKRRTRFELPGSEATFCRNQIAIKPSLSYASIWPIVSLWFRPMNRNV
jgi:Na+/proline symporter